MQFLNNDMDELMRRAATGYEPAVSGMDWDSVAQKLDEAPPAAAPFTGNSRRYGLLALFLLSSLVCNKYLFLNFGKWGVITASEFQQYRRDYGPMLVLEKGKRTSEVLEQNRQKNHLPKNVSKPFYHPDVVKHQKSNGLMPADNQQSNNSAQLTEVLLEPELRMQKTFETSGHFTPKKIFENLALQKIDLNISTYESLKLNETKKHKRLYGGPIALFDASTVKFQQLHAGWQGGVLLGYQLSRKWAVETGVLWGKKSYYAEGKDFNTSKITLPSHSNIIHAEGYCNMFEIPLQVKYDFNERKKSSLFATVGASSYIMQKEEYDYLYERYNVEYYSNKYYKTSSKHFMATVNLSAGYQYKLGRSTVRVEPYIKLPVQKMGVGSLPITSVGLQAGLTYPIR